MVLRKYRCFIFKNPVALILLGIIFLMPHLSCGQTNNYPVINS